ncbi:MAG TPA: alanine racemase [Burkholderiales bacterium]|nr:alanine racemase [Burkholderiales bacterium]
MPRPIRATFDLAAMRANLALARARAAGAKTWAVVKANAYGHGLLRAARVFEATDGFALLDLNEAVRLREAGVRQPILLLEGIFEVGDVAVVCEHSLSIVVHNAAQIEMLELSGAPTRMPVYLKINTGMNRLGFHLTELPAVLERLQRCIVVGPITLMTHFSDADGPMGVAEQLKRFGKATAKLGLPISTANSAALLRYPQTHGDWTRPGIMLYGGSPFDNLSAEEIGLQPAMTLSSALIAVQELKTGESTGYGNLFRADRTMRVGVVAAGYADGYPRHAPTGTPVLVNGKRTRTVGRVSMDMMTVDLSDIPEANIGTPVTLWGEGLPADEVALFSGTVSYELFCALSARVPQTDRAS